MTWRITVEYKGLTMRIGVQVGQIVARGYDLQRQWLEHFRACREAARRPATWTS